MREEGFYWVRPTEHDEWEVALWDGRFWSFVGTDSVWKTVFCVGEKVAR